MSKESTYQGTVTFPNGLEAPDRWKQIRSEILRRDGHRCKHCKVPEREIILRVNHAGEDRYIILRTLSAYDANTGRFLGRVIPDTVPIGKSSRVVLDIAFLDGNPDNAGYQGCRPNLAALCQRCHREVGLSIVARELQARRDYERQAPNGPILPLFG